MDEWHFPRQDLAAHYLDKLDLGLSNNLAIFAPRRKGKSEFALMDLIPEAIKRGYFPIYNSLWSDINSPHKALIEDLLAYTAAANNKNKLKELLDSKIKKLTVNLYGIAKGEVEFPTNAITPTTDDLSTIRRLVSNLASIQPGKIILVIDEVQHLTTDKSFSGLSHTLRTLLDSLDGIRGVFTGSSRSGMSLLFGNKGSPFFQFVSQENFPELDHKFIQFMLSIAKKEYGLLVSEKEFTRCFIKLDSSPYCAKKMLELLIMKNETSVLGAMTTTLAILVNINQYDVIFSKMNSLDVEIYLRVADKKSLFSIKAISDISLSIGVDVTKSRIQKSVTKLSKKGYLSKMMTGSYEIELMGFAEWLKQDTR